MYGICFLLNLILAWKNDCHVLEMKCDNVSLVWHAVADVKQTWTHVWRVFEIGFKTVEWRLFLSIVTTIYFANYLQVSCAWTFQSLWVTSDAGNECEACRMCARHRLCAIIIVSVCNVAALKASWCGAVVTHLTCNEKIPGSTPGISSCLYLSYVEAYFLDHLCCINYYDRTKPSFYTREWP